MNELVECSQFLLAYIKGHYLDLTFAVVDQTYDLKVTSFTLLASAKYLVRWGGEPGYFRRFRSCVSTSLGVPCDHLTNLFKLHVVLVPPKEDDAVI